MAIDIYTRNPDDHNYVEGQLELTEELDLFISELEMVLLTRKAEVLGHAKFGSSLEAYIHTFNFDARRLRQEIDDMIKTYCTYSNRFPYKVDVNFIKGTVRDIGVIDIYITNTKVLGLIVT